MKAYGKNLRDNTSSLIKTTGYVMIIPALAAIASKDDSSAMGYTIAGLGLVAAGSIVGYFKTKAKNSKR